MSVDLNDPPTEYTTCSAEAEDIRAPVEQLVAKLSDFGFEGTLSIEMSEWTAENEKSFIDGIVEAVCNHGQ